MFLMLDHSRRHEKKKVNGLDTGSDTMNVGYGGEQIIQRPTLIKSIDEFCGPYWNNEVTNHVGGGEEEKMVFPDSDHVTVNDGPFEMTNEERLHSQLDM